MNEIINPIFQLFNPQIVDNSISSYQLAQYVSDQGLNTTNNQVPLYKIMIRDLESYHDLSKGYLEFVYRITVGPADANILAATTRMHTNALAIFKKMTLSLNNNIVCEGDQPGVHTSIRKFLEWSDDYLRKHGVAQGFYLEDAAVGAANTERANNLLVYDNGGAPAPAPRLRPRRVRVSVPLDQIFKFCDDFRGVVRGMEVKLELEKETQLQKVFQGAGAGADGNTITIDELALYVPKVLPSPKADQYFLNSIKDAKENSIEARINYEDWTVYQSQKFPVSTNFNWSVISSNKKPKKIFFGVKLASRIDTFDNAANANPSMFDANVRTVSLRLNGQVMPVEPYNIKWSVGTDTIASNYLRPYRDLVSMSSDEFDNGGLLNYSPDTPGSYPSFFPIFGWDLSNEGSKLFENVSDNNINLSGEFGADGVTAAIGADYYLYCVIVWEKQLSIKSTGTNQIVLERI